MEKEPENIEDMLNLLPPSRQQIARRKLAKIAEENPDHLLMHEITYAKLVEIHLNTGSTTTKSIGITIPAESPTHSESFESLKKDIISEVVSLRKDMARLVKVEEDTRHIRTCTNTTLSKLEAVVPYRAKIAVWIIIAALIAGAFAGWHANIAYEDFLWEQNQRGR